MRIRFIVLVQLCLANVLKNYVANNNRVEWHLPDTIPTPRVNRVCIVFARSGWHRDLIIGCPKGRAGSTPALGTNDFS